MGEDFASRLCFVVRQHLVVDSESARFVCAVTNSPIRTSNSKFDFFTHRTLRSARSLARVRAFHWLGCALGEAERIR